MPRSAKLSSLVVLSLALFVALPARAQDEKPNPEEIQKVVKPLTKANKAAQAKNHAEAISAFEEVYKALEGAKLPEKVKQQIERSARYNHACSLALSGKKADALTAFARAVELGFYDWKHI